MSKKKRRQLTPKEKLALLKRHHIEKTPVSELCNEQELQPSLFYQWQHKLFELGTGAFEQLKQAPPSREKELLAKVLALEAKLKKKDEVIAEISEEFVKLKKELGEP
jgi:transposase-like protein